MCPKPELSVLISRFGYVFCLRGLLRAVNFIIGTKFAGFIFFEMGKIHGRYRGIAIEVVFGDFYH